MLLTKGGLLMEPRQWKHQRKLNDSRRLIIDRTKTRITNMRESCRNYETMRARSMQINIKTRHVTVLHHNFNGELALHALHLNYCGSASFGAFYFCRLRRGGHRYFNKRRSFLPQMTDLFECGDVVIGHAVAIFAREGCRQFGPVSEIVGMLAVAQIAAATNKNDAPPPLEGQVCRLRAGLIARRWSAPNTGSAVRIMMQKSTGAFSFMVTNI